MIKIEIEGLKEVQKMLSPKTFLRVTNRTINDLAKKVKSEVSREIRDEYNIPAWRLNKNLQFRRSDYSTLSATLTFYGITPGLQHYQMRQIKVAGGKSYTLMSDHKGAVYVKGYKRKNKKTGEKYISYFHKKKKEPTEISVEVKKGRRRVVKKAFVLFPKKGGVGIFKRVHKGEGGLRRLFGPSVRGMAKATDIPEKIKTIIKKHSGEILQKAIKRYIRKY